MDFKGAILAVRVRKERIVVSLEHVVYVFAFADLTLQGQYVTLNPAGLLEISSHESSVVLACTELGDPQLHSCTDVPFVLAGGGNGAFRTGRYLDFKGAPHQKLMVSLCRAMGLANDSFGKTDYGTGELAGLLGA